MTTKVNYKRYLASREWRLKRKEVIERAKGVCERCLDDDIANVHHLTYENVGNEPLDDLQGLCRGCHEYESGERDDDPRDEAKRYAFWKHGIKPLFSALGELLGWKCEPTRRGHYYFVFLEPTPERHWPDMPPATIVQFGNGMWAYIFNPYILREHDGVD